MQDKYEDPRFDPDDYENRQDEANRHLGGGEGFDNIFDSGFNGAARSEMYRSWVAPELFPHEKPARLPNWHSEDLWAYCGIPPCHCGGKVLFSEDPMFAQFKGMCRECIDVRCDAVPGACNQGG